MGSKGPRRDLQLLREFRARPGQGPSAAVKDNGDAILAKMKNLKRFVKNQRSKMGETSAKQEWFLTRGRLRDECEQAEKELMDAMKKIAEGSSAHAQEMAQNYAEVKDVNAARGKTAQQLLEEIHALRALAKDAQSTELLTRASPQETPRGPSWNTLTKIEDKSPLNHLETTLSALVQEELTRLNSNARQDWEALGSQASQTAAEMRALWPSAAGHQGTVWAAANVGDHWEEGALAKLFQEFPLVDDEVRAGIVQEMNKLKMKYAERMEACKKEVELLWPGDRPNTGGWSAADHARFVRIRGTAVKSAEGKGPAREALLTALANALPDIAKEIGLSGISQHEDWHHMHRIILDRQRSINRSQAEDVEHLLSQSRSLLEKVRGMQLAKAEAAAQLLQQEAGLLQRHMRLDVLRTDHFHRQAELQALQAEQEAEAAVRQAEVEALRQEERERQRVLIDEYRKRLAELKKEKEMEEEEAARAQQLLMDEQSQLNAERVEYRQQEYLAKLELKKEEQDLKQLEEMAKEERLAKLRAQVEPSVEADTERMMAPTAAHAQHSDVSSKVEMFSVHGYDTDKLLQDKRFRVMEALAGANIKNADLRMAALEGTKPMRAPRMDNMTTMQKESAQRNG